MTQSVKKVGKQLFYSSLYYYNVCQTIFIGAGNAADKDFNLKIVLVFKFIYRYRYRYTVYSIFHIITKLYMIDIYL